MGMIQIRNVPDDVHRTLKARAAQAGVSLSDYVLARIEGEARLPSLEEWFERVRRLTPISTTDTAADIIQKGREGRDAHLDRVLEEGKQRDLEATRRNGL